MALPVAVAAGAAKLLAIPGVKAAAMAGAQKIAMDVYGRVMRPEPAPEVSAPAESLQALIADIPTRDEIVASFALLQAEQDRKHRRTFYCLIASIVLQIAVISVVIART